MRVLAAIVACLVSAQAWASVSGPPAPLEPATYRSPSTQHALHVNPSNPAGAGPCEATMTTDGETAWSKTLDFTLWNAWVLDDGSTLGYAYSWGEAGWGYRVENLPKTNELWIVRMDAEGRVIVRDAIPREDNRSFICAPTFVPTVADATLLTDQDRVVFRTIQQGRGGPEDWLVYSLSTGERVHEAHVPEPPMRGNGTACAFYACQVPAAPNLCVLWDVFRYSGKESSHDMRLAILDLEGREVWGVSLPGESESTVDHSRRRIRFDADSLLYTSATTGLTTRYRWRTGIGGMVAGPVEASLTGAIVPSFHAPSNTSGVFGETAEGQHHGAPENPFSEIDPGTIQSISLAPPGAPAQVIGGIYDFGIDDRGRIGWVRRADGDLRFTTVDAEGAVVSDWPVGDASTDRLRSVVWCSGDRWLMFDSGIGGTAAAWWIDSGTGEVTPVAQLSVGGLRCVAPLPDGGFVGQAGDDWVRADSVKAFDPDGRERWSASVSSAQDVAVTSTGEIVVLEGIRATLRWFDAAGRETRTQDLAEVLGKKPNYVAGLDRDVDGGLILHDFHGSPPIYRIDAAGLVRATCTPIFASRQEFSMRGHAQVGPDGSLWTSDGNAFLRLGEDGVVAHVVGEEPVDRALTEVSGFTVGPDGRLYAVNAGNAALHVFDAQGAPIAVHYPDPTDFSAERGFASVAIATDGSIYYNSGAFTGSRRGSGYLHLAPDGTRIGWSDARLGEVREDWCWIPGSPNRWALGYESLALLDGKGVVIRRIDRRPNGDWIGLVVDGAVGADGSLAVIVAPASFGAGTVAVCIYSAGGDPITQFPAEEGGWMQRIVYAHPYVLLINANDVLLCDVRSGGAPRRVALPRDADGRHTVWDGCAAPDAKSVYLREPGGARLLRVQLPDPQPMPPSP